MISDYCLEDAVENKVEEFVNRGNSFSVHDVTNSIRNDVNTMQYTLTGYRIYGDVYDYRVDHNDVKTIFYNFLNNGTFDLSRTWAGNHFEYSPVSYGTTAPVVSDGSTTTTVASYPPNTTVYVNLPESEIKRRIQVYLEGCKTRGFYPTLKQICSAAKRTPYIPGITVKYVHDLVKSLGYKTDE